MPTNPQNNAVPSCCRECGGVLYSTRPIEDRTLCNSDGAAAKLLLDMACLKHEEFRVIALDVRLQVIGVNTIAVGGTTECMVDPGQVFRFLLETGASRAVIAHNHPSGISAPSEEDDAVTARLVSGGELLGIGIIDHLIIVQNGHYSYTAAGRLPKA